MKIRHATENDLGMMEKIDKDTYGVYGANREYFAKKLNSFHKGVLVVEDKDRVTGFTIIEILSKNEIPNDFCDLKLSEPINGKWMHVVVFTTSTNYSDKESDTKLLISAEKVGKSKGCIESCVPLSKDHPFRNNGVFEFWETNGYKKVGKIKWVPDKKEFVECYFYKKKL